MKKKFLIRLLFFFVVNFTNCKGQKLKEKYTSEFCTLLLHTDSTYHFEFKEAKYNQSDEKTYNSGKWSVNGKYVVLNSLKYIWSSTPNYIEVLNPKTERPDSILISIYNIQGGDTTLNRFDVSTIECDDNKFIVPLNGFPYKTKTPDNLNYFILWYLTGKCERKYLIKDPKTNEYKIYIDSSINISDKPVRFEYFESEQLKIINNKLLFLNKVELK